ncbi:hypothetical protein [Thioclava sp. JE_KL1]|uniref:hypothetical protein n=1 Tax=Thioclava sp. JE_KL1 TaxID=2651187 RepID=UPI00128E175B|nr:hypothetical protein [Thioclava sp. JE_KL1]MPQ94607.1 hypothetical protein [Thioclava sp. JE_KL1]
MDSSVSDKVFSNEDSLSKTREQSFEKAIWISRGKIHDYVPSLQSIWCRRADGGAIYGVIPSVGIDGKQIDPQVAHRSIHRKTKPTLEV